MAAVDDESQAGCKSYVQMEAEATAAPVLGLRRADYAVFQFQIPPDIQDVVDKPIPLPIGATPAVADMLALAQELAEIRRYTGEQAAYAVTTAVQGACDRAARTILACYGTLQCDVTVKCTNVSDDQADGSALELSAPISAGNTATTRVHAHVPQLQAMDTVPITRAHVSVIIAWRNASTSAWAARLAKPVIQQRACATLQYVAHEALVRAASSIGIQAGSVQVQFSAEPPRGSTSAPATAGSP